ncbi:uncharacterized protein LOC102385316 [Alligator sinensis]|uniref:Uncharacterized protein LOC102385316 n=1 Tax=Alligator sinensis TaxID=38654 RepID=A0A1U8DVV4_ALLSI|nr:uncharacterized protein LOC102385316 [Alligator sinensis]XP_014381399.1 uncharacterized protein LOC102385316 [Alligator sinensis]XP_014381400.1 uncharacterized protein LOC102385316 [Alligator sinensis]
MPWYRQQCKHQPLLGSSHVNKSLWQQDCEYCPLQCPQPRGKQCMQQCLALYPLHQSVCKGSLPGMTVSSQHTCVAECLWPCESERPQPGCMAEQPLQQHVINSQLCCTRTAQNWHQTANSQPCCTTMTTEPQRATKGKAPCAPSVPNQECVNNRPPCAPSAPNQKCVNNRPPCAPSTPNQKCVNNCPPCGPPAANHSCCTKSLPCKPESPAEERQEESLLWESVPECLQLQDMTDSQGMTKCPQLLCMMDDLPPCMHTYPALQCKTTCTPPSSAQCPALQQCLASCPPLQAIQHPPLPRATNCSLPYDATHLPPPQQCWTTCPLTHPSNSTCPLLEQSIATCHLPPCVMEGLLPATTKYPRGRQHLHKHLPPSFMTKCFPSGMTAAAQQSCLTKRRRQRILRRPSLRPRMKCPLPQQCFAMRPLPPNATECLLPGTTECPPEQRAPAHLPQQHIAKARPWGVTGFPKYHRK